jgi:hypothetical protein
MMTSTCARLAWVGAGALMAAFVGAGALMAAFVGAGAAIVNLVQPN